MGQKPQISIDTDILIKVFRGDKRKKKILDDNSGKIAVSIITCFERPSGLKIKQRIINLNQKIKAYDVIHLYEAISRKAFKIFQKYIAVNNLAPADALAVSTAITTGLQFVTDNNKDFNFIKKLQLFEQNN